MYYVVIWIRDMETVPPLARILRTRGFAGGRRRLADAPARVVPPVLPRSLCEIRNQLWDYGNTSHDG